MFKKMNLPNKITMLRIILVPVFIVFLALPQEWLWTAWVALGVFVVAALSDMIDGMIARKKNLITKFGKVMDPLADKLLVSAGFIMLTGLGVMPAWITAIIIFRDFFVNALRMFGANDNEDMSAGFSGKLKTVFELVAIPLAILGTILSADASFGAFITSAINMGIFELLVNVFMTVTASLAVVFTLWSLVDYFLRFKKNINVEE